MSYVNKGIAGNQVLNSLALSPDYENDHTVLAGNINGSVFFSNDNGLVFEPLPFDAAEPPLSGNITVAFAANYSQNKTVYAADDTAGKGIYRFVIGGTSWEIYLHQPAGKRRNRADYRLSGGCVIRSQSAAGRYRRE